MDRRLPVTSNGNYYRPTADVQVRVPPLIELYRWVTVGESLVPFEGDAAALWRTDDGLHLGLFWRTDGFTPLMPPGTPTWGPGTKVSFSQRALAGFLNLGDAPPSQILRFAQQWGVLELCHHNLPASHNPEPPGVEVAYGEPEPWCRPRRSSQPWGYPAEQGWEPVYAWRCFSRQAYALLTIAQLLDQPRTEAERDAAWNIIWDTDEWLEPMYPSGTSDPFARERPTDERGALARRVNRWLLWSGVVPRLEGRGGDIRWVFAGRSEFGLFTVLAVQLMFAVTNIEGWARCMVCKRFYVPERRPSEKRRNYCPNDDCRKRGAWRLSKQKLRTGAVNGSAADWP